MARAPPRIMIQAEPPADVGRFRKSPVPRNIDMLKEVLIASVAVVLALVVVSFVMPRRFADAYQRLLEHRDRAENSIPPEREIAILKAKIDALEKDDGYQF